MKTHGQCAKSERLSQLIQDQVDDHERTLLESHVETCEVCQRTLDMLVDEDGSTDRLRSYLRQSRPVADPVLRDVMNQIHSTTCGTNPQESIQLHDFAVDYLHPTDDPNGLGRLGPYEIIEVIGSGGMGIVLKGFDAKLNRVVAIKVLTPAFALNSTARKRFLREAQAAAAVSHPNVVAIHSVDEDRLPYLVMEFVDGPSLQERLDYDGFLGLNQILRIGVQVASGLSAAHAQGLVHRDIKPGNILLEKGVERVKITDFGLARAADDASVTKEGTIVGTPQYMSPEQARGETVDQTSDLFSLGSVLYTLATGRLPFRAESCYGVMRRITDETPTPIRELNPEIPEWLCSIISRLMEKKKEARFQSVVEVHELLETCLSHTQQPTVTALPKSLEPPPKRPTSRFFPFLAGATAMITLATGLLMALGFPLTPQPDDQANQGGKTVETSDADNGSVAIAPSPTGSTKRTTYEDFIVVDFPNPNEIGTLNVDIKRGSIYVTGYEGDKILVELSVPNFSPPENKRADGLRELRPNTPDFEVEKSKDQVKLDGNSHEYITNLKIKVPRKTNLILDSYRDGVIQVEQVEGTFNVRSQNNNIRITKSSGSGKFYAYNGAITGDFEKVTNDVPLKFDSYNGTIDLTLPSDTKASVRYKTGKGSFRTDFELDTTKPTLQERSDGTIQFDEFVLGTLNGGGRPLTIETENGDILLRRRMSEQLQ